ncbi:MAG: crosslink repair DNA glycosylase YcaQ family protein [Anaerolineales bacterium]
MPDPIVISKAQARRFLLGHLRLLPPRKLQGKEGVLDYVRHVNCIQYDPINIVGQNPHLVLQSRVRNYKSGMLKALLYEDRKLIDGFDKQMSIYPLEDWPDFSYYRKEMAKRYMQSSQTAAAARLVDQVKRQIKKRGPLSSIDLEDDTRMDWWLAGTVRAVRITMDILFYGGETVVHHRTGTRRYFDLSQRVLPAKLRKPRPHSSHEEYLDWHVLRRAGGVGLPHWRVSEKYGGLVGWSGGRVKAAIARLEKRGLLLPVKIEGLEREKFHIRRQDLPALEAAARESRIKPAAAFIAPLDNLMWDRKLIALLFDFHYVWEVYIPAEKRKHGYYAMPVLYGERLIARMDPEFDRASKTFIIKSWWWEKGVDKKDEAMLAALQDCISAFGRYLDADGIRLGENAKKETGLARAVKRANTA